MMHSYEKFRFAIASRPRNRQFALDVGPVGRPLVFHSTLTFGFLLKGDAFGAGGGGGYGAHTVRYNNCNDETTTATIVVLIIMR
jgi:hypothetical protein